MAPHASPRFARAFDHAPVAPRRMSLPWYPPRQARPAAPPARPVPPIAPSAAFPTWVPSWEPRALRPHLAPDAAASAAAFAPRQEIPTPQAATPPIPPPPTRPTSQRPTPPEPPLPPLSQRLLSLEPPRRPIELAWLTWQLSDALRQQTKASLRETLRWRASACGPLPEPEQPIARARFDLRGEQLVPQADKALCALLAIELRETVRTMEATLSWSQRNYRLVMHSARLGQLCRDLERRGSVEVLEVIRAGLEPMWE